jgi:amino acid transporter
VAPELVQEVLQINRNSYAFSIAAFAYVGVDITAATALEARPDKRNSRDTAADVLKGRWPYISVRFVATWTSFLVWIIYFIAGFLMSLNVEWNDENLPQLSWLGSPSEKDGKFKTDSGFVISAVMSGIPGLADLITAIIFVTAVFSANTNLYVASRTLFGLTRRIQGDGWRIFAFFGKTNNYQVPVRAMLLSLVFMWVPFLYLSPHNSADTTISSVSLSSRFKSTALLESHPLISLSYSKFCRRWALSAAL